MALAKLESLPRLTDDELEMADPDLEHTADLYRRSPIRFEVYPDPETFGTPAQIQRWETLNTTPRTDLPIATLRIADLTGTQPHVVASAVEEYIRNPTRLASVDGLGRASDLPVVMRFDGKVYLLDGHHRTAAQHLLGEERIGVRLIDLDAVPKAPTTPMARALTTTKARTTRVDEHAIIRQILDDPSPDMGAKLIEKHAGGMASGDAFLGRLYTSQGFDGLPTLVDEDEFERLLPSLQYEAYRGMQTKQNTPNYPKLLMEGDYFPGFGIYGNGTYAALTKQSVKHGIATSGDLFGISIANQYADGSTRPAVVRFALKPDAKVLSFSEVERLREQYRHDVQQEFRRTMAALSRRNPPDKAEQIAAARRDADRRHDLTRDLGRFATMLGIDAYEVEGNPYIVVLNRTAMVISKTVRHVGAPR